MRDCDDKRYIFTNDDDIKPSDKNLWEELSKAIERFLNEQPPSELTLFTSGTGIPDEMWIEYYKDTNIPVITRDGSTWRRGVKVE